MKKILYILFAVSILSVGCTKEVLVSRDHDLYAQVTDMKTNMEMKTLYCNLNEGNVADLQKLGEYLTAQDATVVMFVAPTTVGETKFKSWLSKYASEKGGLTVFDVTNYDNRLIMAALIKDDVKSERIDFNQGARLNNAVLHFKANGVHFVVTEMLPAKNAIPVDWEDQVSAMSTNKKTVPLEYDPDHLADRKTELSYIIKQTVDNIAYVKDVNWYFAINMNAKSHLDLVKYDEEFLRKDYYNGSNYEDDPDAAESFDWDYFLSYKTKYFSISETLDANDIYFSASQLMMYYNLVDCNAVHHSVYTPSSTEDEEGLRCNFVYATDECWTMFQSFDFDTAVAADLGVTHYPIIVTLKSEE